jgi:ABC-type oligopeptide transport system substrate-binding subunit
LQQVAKGQLDFYDYSTLGAWFFSFGLGVNETAMQADFGSQYHIPPDYFANLYVRKAFAYAFNYTNYVDVSLGNEKYGIDFGDPYAGAVIQGLAYHVPENQLQNVPAYNLTYAKQLLLDSGEYNVSINIPIGITTVPDEDDFAGAQVWAAAVHSIDPNIVMTLTYVSNSVLYSWVPGSNPLPLSQGAWFADYPYASDFVDGMYKEGGFYASLDGWSVNYLNSTGHSDQAASYAQMNSLINEADSTTNATLAGHDYKQAEQLAINLYMYVYTVTDTGHWIVKPYITGYRGQTSYLENPISFSPDYWWVKGCATPQACATRNIGP